MKRGIKNDQKNYQSSAKVVIRGNTDVFTQFLGRPAAETRVSSGLLGAEAPHRVMVLHHEQVFHREQDWDNSSVIVSLLQMIGRWHHKPHEFH